MSLLKTQNPFYMPTKTLSLLFIRNLASSRSQTDPTKTNKKPLYLLFEEAVGLREKTEAHSESESESNELKKGLRELENEVNENVKMKELKKEPKKEPEKEPKKKPKKENNLGLYNLFLNEKRRQDEVKRVRREEEETKVFKELSPDMKLLLNHLYQKGYFKKANFVPDNEKKLDLSCFNDDYSRTFIKFAADRLGKDNQEIAKWLSGGDLKKVALFGCPSLAKKSVFSAKQLRNFFEIQEDTVCSNCVLRHSCNFVNQSVWKGGNRNLRLADVMRVITLYALESVPPELQVPDDVKASISVLLKEVINLTQTTSKATLTSAC